MNIFRKRLNLTLINFLWSFLKNHIAMTFTFFKKKRKLFPEFKKMFQSSFFSKECVTALTYIPPSFLVIEY